MLQVYVMSANDLPKMDLNGKADPYCNVYGSDYKDKFKCGQTKIIKKDLNPNWDPSCAQPFSIPFTAAKSLKFELFDYDAVGSHDKIGSAKFDFFINQLNTVTTLQVKPKRDTKHRPTLTVKVVPPFNLFQQMPYQPQYTYLYFFLTMNPPSFQRNVHLQLFEFSPDEKCPFQHIAYGNKANGIKMDSMPNHVGPTGFTHCIRVNLLKKRIHFYVPFIYSTNYQGVASIHVAASTKPNKTKNAKGKKSFDSSQMNIILLNHYDVNVTNIGKPEAVFPGMLVAFQNAQVNFLTTMQFFRSQETSLMGIARKYANQLIPNTPLNVKFAITTGRPISFFTIAQYHDIPVPNHLSVALGWDTETDLDSSIICLNKSRKVDKTVYFGYKIAYSSAIQHMGDNLTGRGSGDDERIMVRFDQIPEDVTYLAVTITSFRNVPFTYVKGGFLRLFIPDNNKELLYLPLKKQKNKTCLFFAMFVKINGQWYLFPVMKYYNANTAEVVSKEIEQMLNQTNYIKKMTDRIIE
ncbi:hypothetical protein TRFO_24724 [Tritrichomonas foetus]|uniref:C2 domain-containing protein n=1 Tax=Tritrichomonas foetus TaxID=1144522 RepID=A0A1J4K6J7_9EUKA|nr:hypothetical protein TRFO_24724 [Tritrichomonas foetus]|eukprot:OHT07015.1 hypothetical protein TRFO_24724 [Tritrichomonas foetus]